MHPVLCQGMGGDFHDHVSNPGGPHLFEEAVEFQGFRYASLACETSYGLYETHLIPRSLQYGAEEVRNSSFTVSASNAYTGEMFGRLPIETTGETGQGLSGGGDHYPGKAAWGIGLVLVSCRRTRPFAVLKAKPVQSHRLFRNKGY